MVYQDETPWHKLGQDIGSGQSPKAGRILAGIESFEVHGEPLFLQDGRKVDRKAILNSANQTILGTVGMDYEIMQYAESMSMADDIVDLETATAGLLGNGERAWLQLQMPGEIVVNGKDKVSGYLLIVSSHDGSLASEARFTAQRVVCQNTLSMAMRNGKSSVKFRHTQKAKDKLEQSKEILSKAIDAMLWTGQTFNHMAERQMSTQDVVTYIESVFGPGENETLKDRKATVADLVWTGKGARMAGSSAQGTTAWACYNAVTEYFDHVRPAEAKSSNGMKAANQSALFGANAITKQKAFTVARQLVTV